MGWWLGGMEVGGLSGMEENKKSGGGDVRAEALAWDDEWEKPENSFSALSPLSPTVGCFAPHSHPSPPEKKAASRKKSRLRRKKTAAAAKKMVHRVYHGWCVTTCGRAFVCGCVI